ncbi:inositol monophosphatase family protein [Acanthopleuribacter pedis]|uniref:3'(2'),5-bisphosphonucleoside 3'(2')-phosphohydrolase n=1 Tax=Acanthopleuribacter pedis TaxID=442870 RepID=A0A8J7QS91_9BACT|nr:inositol monophosphatase family protein [Acanthopleuribacter pedis]MBO1323335.1 inositol monophosphatase family protein [Acanthopleuribacter pedis]
MNSFPYNTHQLKDSVQELVRRAIEAIRAKRFHFEAKSKANPRKTADLLTDADLLAQEIVAGGLQERFPEAGIVGEENLFIPSNNGVTFTIDPLDGTKAFVRQESGNVAVMIGVLFENRVVSAFIGDVWTKEIFYFRPGSPNTHRLIDFDFPFPLVPFNPDEKHRHSAILFREDPYRIPGFDFLSIRDTFTKVFIESGSIGINFTKLFKGETHALFIHMKYYTPWDHVPVIGLARQLGYGFYRLENQMFTPFAFDLKLETYTMNALLLVCHPSLVAGLNEASIHAK